MVISGLTIVKAGGSTYIGMLKVKSKPLFLEKALELIGVPTPRGAEQMAMQITAMPVLPFNMPVTMEIPNPSVIIDASRDGATGEFYQSFVGPIVPGLHLPDGVL